MKNIPNVEMYPLKYVFEKLKLQHKPNTLWLEFGVASGNTINYISKFTNDKVYGFDSLEGLPEKSCSKSNLDEYDSTTMENNLELSLYV